ncbi:hypothetical protein D3C78_986340 [compost metagenome]
MATSAGRFSVTLLTSSSIEIDKFQSFVVDVESNNFLIASIFNHASIDFTPFVSVRSNANPDIFLPLTSITTVLSGKEVVGKADELEPLPELGALVLGLAAFRVTSRLYFLIVPS